MVAPVWVIPVPLSVSVPLPVLVSAPAPVTLLKVWFALLPYWNVPLVMVTATELPLFNRPVPPMASVPPLMVVVPV